jgi:hypothetical protein
MVILEQDSVDEHIDATHAPQGYHAHGMLPRCSLCLK